MRFAITYDLLTPGKDYQALREALSDIGATRVLSSQWVLRRETTAPALRDHLRRYVDPDDRLLVTCLDSDDWAGFNLLVRMDTL